MGLAKPPILGVHHLMRFVPYSQQIRDSETDAFKGIANIAFTIRPDDDGGLSTTWVEHYGDKSPTTVAVAASHFRETLNSKKLPSKAYFAVGTVSETQEASLAYGKRIRVVSVPDGVNTGHVEIRRFSDEDRRLLDTLAIDVFREHIAVAGMVLSKPMVR